MTDATIRGRNIEAVKGSLENSPPFSWGAVVAGAVTALSVSFILLALGAGIGLVTASPYGGPSATALTAAAAIWIVLSQTWGYAFGGYIAGRMRTRAIAYSGAETNFRDGAHGFVAWALGVVLFGGMVALGGAFTVGTTAHVGATLGAGAASGAGAAAGGQGLGYYADGLFRADPARAAQTPAPQLLGDAGNAAGPAQSGSAGNPRNEASTILGRIATRGELSGDDRTYLAKTIAARTGISEADAQQRVATAEKDIKDSAKAAADTARKAASYFSFWTFMSLLMGMAAAVAGGIFGGNQRDERWSLRS